MTLHVFDFDGVLFDTARECLAVAFATARRWPGFEAWRQLESPPDSVAERFLANRHWVGPPWQYAVLLDCILRDALPTGTDGFLAVARPRQGELAEFTDRYFATRTELSRDVARWCAVIRPYAPATAALAQSHAAGKAAILSTRDELSIRKILAHFLGPDHADIEQLPRAGTKEKWQLLTELADRRRLPLKDVFFVDDYVHHALPAHRAGIAAHLALWGYLSAEDIREARAAGLPCVALNDLDRAIARHEEETSS
jgi:phosphoglycolate phosphatase-like HAD superfamily hydrolase